MEGMTLHEIDQEIQSIQDKLKQIGMQEPNPGPDTLETIRILKKARLNLEAEWWRIINL